MREINDLVGTTAVIATLISILFAIAAMFIANRRKKHHLAMQQHSTASTAQMAQHEAVLHFATPPAASPAPPAPAAPVEVAESMMYATRPTSSPLFKRLGRVGVEQFTPTTNNAAPVVNEEQKSAWE